jgi:acetyl esterase/lipase
LHIHGGGYIIGTAKMSTRQLQKALDADCIVASVDYRLAPETTHPGPVEDCYEALKWLHENAASLGIDAARIAVEGESAGAGLAAALALLARDRGEIPIIHQHLIYPMLDDRTCVAETHPYAGEFVWTRKSNFFGWSSLLGVHPGERAFLVMPPRRVPRIFPGCRALSLRWERSTCLWRKTSNTPAD